MKTRILPVIMVLTLGFETVQAQVNSGSNGSDGALDFSAYANSGTNIVINMADHPNGIYQYTYVNIPSGVTVTFIPNANNSPVTWLVQSNVVINGTLNLSGQDASGGLGGVGGPGGWSGGSGGMTVCFTGQGPGGGGAGGTGIYAGGGGFGITGSSAGSIYGQGGSVYGNLYLLPLIGGSGGGGANINSSPEGGGGGGGAILIAASNFIQLNGTIAANGGGGSWGGSYRDWFAGGSGGGVRLMSINFTGSGQVQASGGNSGYYSSGGNGRVRIDAYQDTFSGSLGGAISQGYQPIIIPSAGQGAHLTVTSVGGIPVSASPTGQVVTPDTVLSAQQNNPISIVVSCANLPLHTLITVSVRPASGSPVSATGYNDAGTQASSAAAISIMLPRGGGIIYATATTTN